MTDTQPQPAARMPRLEVECAGCGVPMKIGGKQREVHEAGRPVYHSHACRKQHTWVTHPCACCGKDVTRPRSEVARLTTGRLFCSAECRNKTGSKPKTGRHVSCSQCGKDRWVIPALDTPDIGRYCSRECSNEAQRAGRVEMICEHCGEVELVPPSKVSRFCSRKCTGAARRRQPGETWIDPEKGYVWEFVAEGGRRLQHRLRIEELLGRPMRTEEEVHHLNGDKTDNRVDGPLRMVGKKYRSGNLELWSTSQPAGQEIGYKIDWALDLLRLYAPHLLDENIRDARPVPDLVAEARELLALYGDLVPEVSQ